MFSCSLSVENLVNNISNESETERKKRTEIGDQINKCDNPQFSHQYRMPANGNMVYNLLLWSLIRATSNKILFSIEMNEAVQCQGCCLFFCVGGNVNQKVTRHPETLSTISMRSN